MAKYAGDDINQSTDINIPKTILKKIGEAVDTDIEGLGVRPFRELLQNADDARATTLTMRFDKDKLLIYNDGYTIEHSFVEAIGSIFDSDKENDPETSGNFGSGFRSTYIFTDAPQLEWWDFEKKLVCPHCDKPKMVSSTISHINPRTDMARQLKCSDCGHKGDITDYVDEEDRYDEAGDPHMAFRVYELPLGVDSKLDWTRVDDTSEDRAFEIFGRDSRNQVELDVQEHDHSRLGVVFRFPWRRKNAFPTKAPGWSAYEWNLKKIRELAHELRDYAAKAILGCRHLKTVRIVMAGCAKEEERWDFAVTRNITFSDIRKAELDDSYDPSDTANLPVMEILRTSFDRNNAFFDVDEDSGSWKRTPKTGHQWYDYRELHREAERKDLMERTVEKGARPWKYRAFPSRDGVNEELAEELGFWDFQTILMPLFENPPKLPVYTPIPLAGDSPNYFAIVGALPPTENRLSIDVVNTRKEWLEKHIDVAAKTYESALSQHLNEESLQLEKVLDDSADWRSNVEEDTLREIELAFKKKIESVQLACLPRDAPNRWFGVGGGLQNIAMVSYSSSSFQLIYDAIHALRDVSVVTPGGALTPLHECIYYLPDPDDGRLGEILSIIEAPVLSESWMDYLSEVRQKSAPIFFERVIEELFLDVENNGCMSALVPEQLAGMVSANWEKARDSGKLERASELLLDGICNSVLADEWYEREESVLTIPCVISQDNRIRTIPEFVDTNKCPDLVHILPDSQLVKEEHRDSTISMIVGASALKGISEAIEPTGRRILKLIDQDTLLNPEVHDDLGSHEDVHKAVSKLLRVAFRSDDDARYNLNSREIRNLRFVPCRRHGRVVTLQINTIKRKVTRSYITKHEESTWGYDSPWAEQTLSQLYHREFIFKNMPDALDDLPECIVDRLRFLELHEDIEPRRVANALQLNSIGQGSKKGSKMTNLVRTLLFEHDLNTGIAHSQPSLFREGELDSWLSGPPMHLGFAESTPVCPDCEELMTIFGTDEEYAANTLCDDEDCDVKEIYGRRWHCAECVRDFCVGCGSPEPKEVDYDSNEVKRQLITSLLAPYGEVISEGLGLKDVKDEVPFVLGTDGSWRKGNSYCLALDPSLNNLIDDIDAIDNEFRSGLTDGILGQLGVQSSLGPNAALAAIEARIDDEVSLALLMLSLLSSEKNWANCGVDVDEEAWDELTGNVKWAPTNGAGILYPSQVLYPSEDFVSKLGEDYTHFPPKSMWDALRQTNEEARAKDLGMRCKKVELGVLVLAISGEHTSGNDVEVAVKELHKRLLKVRDDFTFDQLDWGPHAPVDGIKLSLAAGGSVNSSDSPWITDDYDEAQLLGRVFNDKTVVPIGELEHVNRTTIKGIRRMDILKEGPEWHEVLARLTEVQGPKKVQELWSLLLKLGEIPDHSEWRSHEELLDGKSDVKFCLDDETVVVHESLLSTNIEDEHGLKEVDGRTRYYVEDGSIQEDWFGLLGVESAGQLNPGNVLRTLIGRIFDPSDPEQEADLIKVKSLMAECNDGFYVPVWEHPNGIRILDLQDEEAIHPGKDFLTIHPVFRKFPIIHRTTQDPPSFADWMGDLEHSNLTPYMDIASIGTEPLDEEYSVHDPLQDAVKQVIEALSMIHPSVFEDPSLAAVPCMIGSGGIPYVMSMTWENVVIETVIDRERNGCVYDENKDILTLYVDEDDDYGNPTTCSAALVRGLREMVPWYPELKVKEEQTSGAFSRRLQKLIKALLEIDPEDWFVIVIDNRYYGETLRSREWESHGRLFESHSQWMMTQKLKSWYTGCQICSLVTPKGVNTDETQESLIHTIRLSGSHYRGKRDLSRPLGRQLWVCARHRILWDRRLVQFCFMDDAFNNQYTWRGTLSKDVKKLGVERLKKMKVEWEEEQDMDMMVYDQKVKGFAQDLAPHWQKIPMRVKKEHAQAILEQMIGWIS